MKIFVMLTVMIGLALLSSATPLEKRRFGQEHSKFVEPLYQKMRDSAVNTEYSARIGNLSGEAVNALLAAKPACRQQLVADHLIFFAKKMGADKSIPDGKKKEKILISVARKYRTAERNTNQDGKPSFLCGRKPFFKELNGIVQSQDPAATTKPGTPKDAFNLDEDYDPLGVLADIKAASNNKGKKSSKNPKKKKPKKPKCKTGNRAADNPLGGVQMPFIKKKSNGTFKVKKIIFNDLDVAHNRQCAIQHNACADSFNRDKNPKIPNVCACDKQQVVCNNGPPVFAK
ncbi:788_t:CDS:1 [Paraglomus occultum]|uniref:788_t:CDS:1 n=1 Tax=Paraglomus occultum TaxID=144539 RepID=A0A9N9G1S3_9GLOM|nr:788_t:CDS:1 [Paraglomus occultum]